MVDGVSVDSILEEFASYKINGRKVTKKLLNEYIKEASSIIETEEKDMTSDNNTDETGEKVKVEE